MRAELKRLRSVLGASTEDLPPRVKLIFSRKGFDALNGGVPSPIFPDRSYFSLPIPDAYGKTTYREIAFKGDSLASVVASLSRGRVQGHSHAHLDPDLDWRALRSRSPKWRPLFGQAGAAQAHLARAGVTVGDLFLFFGWFRQVESTVDGWRYRADAPDSHTIFGWLRVGEVWPVNGRVLPRLAWTAYHPHVDSLCRRKHNTLYVAAPKLGLPGVDPSWSGGGVFPRLGAELCLSAPGNSRSVWQLPSWFYPQGGRRPLSYHEAQSRWVIAPCHVLLRTTAPGQEFVLDCADYPEAAAWLARLFGSARIAQRRRPAASILDGEPSAITTPAHRSACCVAPMPHP